MTKSCGADCMCMCTSLVTLQLVVMSLSAPSVKCEYIVLHCMITFHYLTNTNEACVKYHIRQIPVYEKYLIKCLCTSKVKVAVKKVDKKRTKHQIQ